MNKNIKVSSKCTQQCLHYSEIIISSIVSYIKALQLELHPGAFTEKKASWRHNKVGLSPTYDDGPVG